MLPAVTQSTTLDLPPMPTKFVSNLPYQVAATLILRMAFRELPSLERAVVMVRRRVLENCR